MRWRYGGTRGNLGRIVPAILFLINNKEFDRPKCDLFHIFGVTSNESMIYFQYLQMLLNKHNIDMPNSWMIGDSERDISAASSAGIKNTILVRSGHKNDEGYSKAKYILNSINDVKNVITL